MTYFVKRMTAVVTIAAVLLTLGCSKEQASTPDLISSADTSTEAGREAGTEATSGPIKPSMKPLARIAPSSRRLTMPEVKLTASHAALCVVNTNEAMPSITLPDLEGREQDLSTLYGENLTVVCFWKGDRALARTVLADLGPDVVKRYGEKGVNVVGIAVEETAQTAEQHVSDAGATFPNLLDTDGNAMALVGTEKLPRTYLLDANGEVLWFDIEYSRTTRRELRKAIRAGLQASRLP